MAKNYEVMVYGQSTFQQQSNRQFEIAFSEPDNSVNEETGILLLISGYGGNLKSNVYKKMREHFADKFNFITIQCNYLGNEFMQDSDNIEIDEKSLKKYLTDEEFNKYINNPQKYIQAIAENREINICGAAILNEDKSNFNDMGPIQAIDNLTAIKVVMDILDDNDFKYNKDKVVAYGHSHGAYICYLCNAFSPNLITTIIDNSAYLYPAYLDNIRVLYKKYGKLTISTEFNYLINNIVLDREIYNISTIYNKFINKANIIAFHGINDNMTTIDEKRKFIDLISNSVIESINQDKIDNIIFKNCDHGLGADFIKLFEYVSDKYGFEFKKENYEYEDAEYITSKFKYRVTYENGIPKLDIKNI